LVDQLVGLDEHGQQLTGFCDRVSTVRGWHCRPQMVDKQKIC
jgi:hypothetical protein